MGHEPRNLLIQGENLEVLRSLTATHAGQVRLIYIDPPYNTGSGDYLYADAMPREQWLRFMVERLEAARPLLIDDAVIAIQCSFHQSAHLEVTLDGLDWLHKVMVFHVLVRHPGRALTADKQFNDVMEQILIYSPDPHFRMPRRERERDLSDYRWEVEIHGPGTPRLLGDRRCHVYAPEEWRKVEVAPGEGTFRTHSVRGSLREKNSSGRFWVAHLEPLDLPREQPVNVPGPHLALRRVPSIPFSSHIRISHGAHVTGRLVVRHKPNCVPRFSASHSVKRRERPRSAEPAPNATTRRNTHARSTRSC